MVIIILGIIGIIVNLICIGIWVWGDKFFWNYGSNYGVNEVEAVFKIFLEVGVNFFDIVEVYGNGLLEELLGKFM